MKKQQNKKIVEDVKLKISISNFKEKERIEMKKTSKNVVKVASVACLIAVSITGVAFAKDIGNFIQNFFGANTSDGVDVALNNGYETKVETQTQKAEGIEIGINSMMIDDFNFAMNFDVTLDEKYNMDEFKSVDFDDLKVVDETGAIVFNAGGFRFETEEMMREKGYGGGYSFLAEKTGERTLKVSLAATGNPKLFPRSKHLSVSFTKLKTWKMNEQTMTQTDKFYEGNWNFEIDVPQESYNRESISYKVKKCNETGIDINRVEAVLSNTGFRLSLPAFTTNKVDYELLQTSTPKSVYDKIALQKEYIETSDGKRFETAQRSDGDGGYGVDENNRIVDYYQTFNLTKYDATNEITVHIATNRGEEITLVLEKNQ